MDIEEIAPEIPTSTPEERQELSGLLDTAISDATKASDNPETQSVETSHTEPPKVEVTPAAPQSVTPDPDLDKIFPPKNISEKGLEGFNGLKTVALKRGLEIGRLSQELNQAKQQLQQIQSQNGKLTPEIEKELTELRKIRGMVDIKNDPEFLSKYDQPLKNLHEEVYGLLKANGVSDENIKGLQGADAIRQYDFAWWKTNVIDPMLSGPSSTMESRKAGVAIENSIKESFKLDYEKDKAIQQSNKDWEVYQQNQTQIEAQEQQANDQQIQSFLLEVQKVVPWAAMQQIPATASPEERARIEDENKWYNEKAEPIFMECMQKTDPLSRAQQAATCVLAQRQLVELQRASQALTSRDERITSMNKQIDELSGKLNGIKKAGILPKSTGTIVKAKAGDFNVNQDDKEAIKHALDEVWGATQ